jgi:hypothetical protein
VCVSAPQDHGRASNVNFDIEGGGGLYKIKTYTIGLEVPKPTQALESVKGLCSTFELNPKWARNLPLGIVYGLFIEPSPHFVFIKVDF